MKTESIFKVLKLIAENDLYDEIYWDTDFNFYVLCNDLFYWATSDGEAITDDSVEEIEKAIKDTNLAVWSWLYSCRLRKMRPQGGAYAYIDKIYWPLFDACGPERVVDLFNPELQSNVSNILK